MMHSVTSPNGGTPSLHRGDFALFCHEFEEDGGAVLQGGRVDGDVGDDIPFGERKFLTTCSVEAKGV